MPGTPIVPRGGFDVVHDIGAEDSPVKRRFEKTRTFPADRRPARGAEVFAYQVMVITKSALAPGSSLTVVKTGSMVEKVPPSQKMTP